MAADSKQTKAKAKASAPPAPLPGAPPEPQLDYEQSPGPGPPSDSEATQRQRLLAAIDAGFNPATDVLTFAKQEEIEAIDRLVAFQTAQGLPLSVVPIAAEKNREQLAALAALRERAHYYFANRPPQRVSSALWVHEGWELDERSEIELLRKVYARIREKLSLPKRSPR